MQDTLKTIRKTILWRDLLSLTHWEVARELTLSLPWLLASFLCYAYHIYPIALACSFMFFLTALRQAHDAYHYAIGLNKAWTEGFILCLSPLMLSSLHAIQFNHLRHHHYNMTAQDLEAKSAKMSGYMAILFGPLFPFLLHHKALSAGSVRIKRWVIAELCLCTLWVGLVFFVFDLSFLKWHVGAMALGECLTAFFAVWTVHHDCDPEGPDARSIRNRFKAAITYNIFYHFEHHLFPAVPTRRLPILAQRLDKAFPDLGIKTVY